MLSLNSSLLRASSALGSLLLGGALLASGCGGGGGGTTVPTATPIPTGTPIPGLVFSDEFNSGSLDRSKWTTLTTSSSLQRTQFGNQPDFSQDGDGTRFMRVKLNSYVPDAAVREAGVLQFFGTEVAANTKYERGNGIEIEAKMRLSNPNQRGMVASFFMFGQKGTFGGTPPLTFDEIDHEVITKALSAAPPYTWTNTYNDFTIAQPGQGGGDSYLDPTKTIPFAAPLTTNYAPGSWSLYRIVWAPGEVRWYINDQLIRTDSSAVIPNDALGVRFNLWAAQAPPLGWEAAWDESLVPAQTAAQNQTYSLDIDYVRIRTLSATTGTVKTPASVKAIPLSSTEITRGLTGPGFKSTKSR